MERSRSSSSSLRPKPWTCIPDAVLLFCFPAAAVTCCRCRCHCHLFRLPPSSCRCPWSQAKSSNTPPPTLGGVIHVHCSSAHGLTACAKQISLGEPHHRCIGTTVVILLVCIVCCVLLSRLQSRLLLIFLSHKSRPNRRPQPNNTYIQQNKNNFARQNSLVIGNALRSPTDQPKQATHRPVSPAARFLARALCVLLTTKQPRSLAAPLILIPDSCGAVHALSTRYSHANAAAATTLRQASSRPSHHRATTVHRRALVALPHTSTSGRRNPRCSSPRPHSAYRHPTRPRLWRPAVPRLRKPSLAGPNLLCRTRVKPSSPNGTWLAGGSNSRGATRNRRTRQVRAHISPPKDTVRRTLDCSALALRRRAHSWVTSKC